jgi:hypothetical protein
MEEKVLEELLERVNKLEKEVANLSKSLNSEEVPPETSKTSYPKILEEWNAELGPFGIPKLTSISGRRARLVSARLREYGKDSFHLCIEEVKHSRFLQGKTEWNGFTFDWLLRPNNFPKVLEGNYNDNRKKEGGRDSLSSSIPQSWING